MQNAGSGPKAACKAHTPGGKALRRPSGAAPSSPPQALRKETEGAVPVDSHTRAAGRGSKALFDEQTPSSALPGSPGPAQPSVCVSVRIKAPRAILPSPGEPLVVPGWALAAASPLPELLEVTFVPSLGSPQHWGHFSTSADVPKPLPKPQLPPRVPKEAQTPFHALFLPCHPQHGCSLMSTKERSQHSPLQNHLGRRGQQETTCS